MKFRVKVKPGSKKEFIKEVGEGELEVAVSSPPQKGKANERLLEILAEHFGISKSRVRVLRGHSSRIKLVEVDV